MRYFFEISYRGTGYHGWQSQTNARGVQQVVEEVLQKLYRKAIPIVASGRTDAGVHCLSQYFHLDIDQQIDGPSALVRVNSFLPKDIAIHAIRKVKNDAHARYDARERVYQYRITQSKNPFLSGFAYHYYKPLQVENMNAAAALLVGMHDFKSFSKVKTDVNHFLCEVKYAQWKEKNGMLVFDIAANRFLRGMVRAIVGSLLDIGTGKVSLAEFKKIIKGKDRKLAGMNVPPEGLYLVNVKYARGTFLR